MANDSSDICSDEQLSIFVRYVSSEPDANGVFIREVFWGFIHLENLNVVGMASKICNKVLEEYWS